MIEKSAGAVIFRKEKWLDYGKALEKLIFKNSRQILQKSEEFLKVK